MNQNVIVKLISEQREKKDYLSPIQRSENTYKATYYKKDQMHYVFYKERMEGLGKELSVRVSFQDSKVTIARSGEINVSLVYDIANTTHSIYVTPFGEFEMEIQTSHISTVEKEKEVTLSIDYEVYMNGEVTSFNSLQMCIKEAGS